MQPKTVLFTNEISAQIFMFADQLKLNVLVEPMIATQLRLHEKNNILSEAINDTAEAWIFTSKNAVQYFLLLKDFIPNYKKKQFYAVGNKTAEALINEGIAVRFPAKEYAQQLAEMIVHENIQSALFWCGNLRREVLPDYLKAKNILLKELVVYDTIPQPKKITAHYDAIAFLSSSAVESFFSANMVSATTPLFAIGETTLQTLKKYTSTNIIIPEKPEVNLLLQQIQKHFSA